MIFLLTAGAVSAQNSEINIFPEFQQLEFRLLNNFLFLIPPLLLNAASHTKLHREAFHQPVPAWITISEQLTRAAVFGYPMALPVNTNHDLFYPGLAVYIGGLVLYSASWFLNCTDPERGLADNVFIKFAPAYTPLIWLTGISMMAESRIEPILSVLFIGFHLLENIFSYDPEFKKNVRGGF